MKVQVTVERATLANLEELWRIERECFTGEAFTREQIESLLRSRSAIGLLARVNSEVAGFIIGMIENFSTMRAGHIYTIDVALKHRRMGVGLKLLSEIEKIFLSKGAETSYLEVRTDNQAAIRLYKKQQYVEAEPLYDYYSSGVDGVRLVKQLRSTRDSFS